MFLGGWYPERTTWRKDGRMPAHMKLKMSEALAALYSSVFL